MDAMTEPAFNYRHGIAEFRNGRALVRLSRFRSERRDDSVRALLEAEANGRSFSGNWILTSSRERSHLAQELGRMDEAVEWGPMLDYIARKAVESFRAGSPIELVGRNPVGEEPPAILDPLLWRDEPTILYGPGGTGKSLLAAAVAVQVQTGVDVVPGMRTILTGPVMVLDWETSAKTWNGQVRSICNGVDIEPVEVRYRRMTQSLVDDAQEVAAMVAEHGILVLIVDSAEAAMGGGDNFNGAAQAFFNALRGLEVTVLVIDHVSGENLQRDKAAKPIGGIAKVNRARATWEYRAEPEPEDGRIELSLVDRKRNGRLRYPPIGLVARLEELDEYRRAHRIWWEASKIEAPELQRGALPKREQMRRLLAYGARPVAEIAAELDMKPGAVREYAGRYAEFMRVGEGIGLAC